MAYIRIRCLHALLGLDKHGMQQILTGWVVSKVYRVKLDQLDINLSIDSNYDFNSATSISPWWSIHGTKGDYAMLSLSNLTLFRT